MDVEKILRENIGNSVHMSLATSNAGKPWVCEVHFAYDEDLNLYFRSLATRRHSQEIASNPNVAGSIVRQHGLDDALMGVYFEGTAEKLEAGEAQDKAFEVLQARVNASDDAVKEAARTDGHQFYKITVSKFYIFSALEPGKGNLKYELAWKGGTK